MKKLMLIIILVNFSLAFSAENFKYKENLSLAWTARQNKNYKNAIKFYNSAIVEDASKADAWIGLLYSYIEDNNLEKSRELAEKTLSLFPKDSWVRKGNIAFYNLVKEYNELAKHYEYLVENTEDNGDLKVELAWAYYNAKEYKKAKIIAKSLGEDYQTDVKIKLCLEGEVNTWSIKPDFYLTYSDYSSELLAEYNETTSFGIDFYNSTGLGLYTHISNVSTKIENTTSESLDIIPGVAVYYFDKDYFLWGNFNSILNNVYGKDFSKTYSLYGKLNNVLENINYGTLNNVLENINLGFYFDLGFYGDFSTYQYTPELEYDINENLSLKGLFMYQSLKNDGNFFVKEESNISFELGLQFKTQILEIDSFAFKGDRYFTIENKGLSVLNNNTKYDWGGKIKITLKSGSDFLPYLSYKIYSIDHDSADKVYTNSFTGGFSYKF